MEALPFIADFSICFVSLLCSPAALRGCLLGKGVPEPLHSFPGKHGLIVTSSVAFAVFSHLIPLCSANPGPAAPFVPLLFQPSPAPSHECRQKYFFQFNADQFLCVAVSGSISAGQRKAEEHLADNWAWIHQKVLMWSLQLSVLGKHLCKELCS